MPSDQNADDDRLASYDYPLDGVRIASHPAPVRDAARLLVHERATATTHHATIRDLGRFLRPGDLLVFNDTRVLPARLFARRASGGEVEVLLHPTGAVDPVADAARAPEIVLALLRPSARVRAGEALALANGARIIAVDPPGPELRRVQVEGGLARALEVGELPLPPYLNREPGDERERDRERYQTVFARAPGAIAAPTAGLHFTSELLAELAAAGIRSTHVTLHVGPGTFLPVRSELLSQHAMHEELYEIGAAAAESIAATRAGGGRIVAVGTTTTRALESAADDAGRIQAGSARTRLMIRPPHRFRAIDALLTNFHLPKTTLLALVSAFAGRTRILALYQEAAAAGYRFYSYGDAMLLL